MRTYYGSSNRWFHSTKINQKLLSHLRNEFKDFSQRIAVWWRSNNVENNEMFLYIESILLSSWIKKVLQMDKLCIQEALTFSSIHINELNWLFKIRTTASSGVIPSITSSSPP